jgi:putative ubiquitin-RnfH superfamily antitoxin RatB of RatAB toxin-antitoxin module
MASAEGQIQVLVTVGLAPREVWQQALALPAGSTVAQALVAAGVWQLAGLPPAGQALLQGWSVGVWGRKEAMGHVLRDGDRVELVRPLIVDPKEARRVRYRAQGEKLPRGIQRSPSKLKPAKA